MFSCQLKNETLKFIVNKYEVLYDREEIYT